MFGPNLIKLIRRPNQVSRDCTHNQKAGGRTSQTIRTCTLIDCFRHQDWVLILCPSVHMVYEVSPCKSIKENELASEQPDNVMNINRIIAITLSPILEKTVPKLTAPLLGNLCLQCSFTLTCKHRATHYSTYHTTDSG